MNIYLIQPPMTGEERYGKYSDVGSYLPPLGLCYLAGVLIENGHNVKIIDGIIESNSFSDICNEVNHFGTDLIGITATSLFYEQAIKLAEYMKCRRPDIKLVLGGVHVSVFPGEALGEFFDFGIYGEGEVTFPELLRKIESGEESFEDIKGLIFRKNGKIVINQPRDYIQNLDSLPHPAIHLLKKRYDYKITALMYKRLPMMTIISSRGCPYNCLFCSNNLFGRKYRFHSVDYVLEELDNLLNQHKFKEIMFYEDNFPVNSERVFGICEGILNRNYNFNWGCSSHVNCLSKEKLDIMKKAGCWIVSIGIESGDERILKKIKKNYNREHLINMVKYADKIGMAVRGFFILGHPTETKESIRKTLELAKLLPLYTVNFCLMSLFPGSDLYNSASEYGQVDYDLSLVTGHPSKNQLSFIADGFSQEELIRLQRQFYRMFYLRPKQILRILKNTSSLDDIIKYYRLLKTFVRLMVK